MKSTDRKIDPLPESFESEEAAGEFWDTHSLTDYEEHLEAADDVTFDITERIFEVRVAEDVFRKLQEQAASLHQPVPKVVDEILRKELTR
jgi:CopG antitoxin of type II toxin-antitoxin system